MPTERELDEAAQDKIEAERVAVKIQAAGRGWLFRQRAREEVERRRQQRKELAERRKKEFVDQSVAHVHQQVLGMLRTDGVRACLRVCVFVCVSFIWWSFLRVRHPCQSARRQPTHTAHHQFSLS